MRTVLDVPRAFPRELAVEASEVATRMPGTTLDSVGHVQVTVQGEVLVIPGRIYNDPVKTRTEWTPTHRLIADCLYTRHDDGRVRESHARYICNSVTPWVVPFIVELIGEYVVEISMAMESALPDLSVPNSAARSAFAAFVVANPEHMRRTSARVVSYWNAYYRADYPALVEYPAHRLLSALVATATAPPTRSRHLP